jgi:hypothetical protein
LEEKKMRIIKLNSKYSVGVEAFSNSVGFKHRATLFENGRKVTSVSAQYYNRTWESYAFETVIHNLLYKQFYKSNPALYKTLVAVADKGRGY